MKFALPFLMLLAGTVQAQELATCRGPSGYAYFPHDGLVSKKDSGFSKDKITGSVTTLRKIGPDEYDILFIDSSKTVVSSKQDGGKVLLARASEDEMVFLVVYRGKTVVVFIFLRTTEGKSIMQILTSRGGSAMIRKNSLLVGECSNVIYLTE